MFENMNPVEKSTATFEILLMLLAASVVGYLLHWVLCNMGMCGCSCKNETKAGLKGLDLTSTENRKDDLKIIEGIGPKIETLLNNSGIYNFTDIVETGVVGINKILEKAGPRFAMHDASSWVEQAKLADRGDWNGLSKLQEKLTAGRA